MHSYKEAKAGLFLYKPRRSFVEILIDSKSHKSEQIDKKRKQMRDVAQAACKVFFKIKNMKEQKNVLTRSG